MLELFHFPYQTASTPMDFITDQATGFRGVSKKKPAGWIAHDLRPGIEGAVLPPLAIWKKGLFLDHMSTENQAFFRTLIPKADRYNSYLVAGEGTPGDYGVRIYVLPQSEANSPEPDHPLLWSEFRKKGQSVTIYMHARMGPWADHREAVAKEAAPKKEKPKVKTTTAKPLPIRLRVRCVGCGHWWKIDDLSVHSENCCPSSQGGLSDWAILCECCDTLDEVSQVKPGFPRPKKEAETPKEEKEPVTA